MLTVFDCNIYFQALIAQKGPAGRCLDAAGTKRIDLIYLEHSLKELRDVCLRSTLAAKFRITPERLDRHEQLIRARGKRIDDVPRVFDYDRDPKDAHYLDLAIAANAKLVISRDKDLLALAEPDNSDGQRLRRLHPGVEVIGPVELLDRLAAR